ncbi:extended synaptotagmin-1 isoform X2 [Rhinichthys klamathensis goyatoka]|uniref:extended synaptotagmin-1 isoform X2 n=1 Tax=Rhinichthys klamathensis goyatoka TaxID=3034132 RepID=UPI0024B5FA68|nr:extended synaptotagmin-1 isoform X2 [Rhinichthys klamathensis goyatoka]
MSHVDSGPKNDSDSEQKTEPARDSSSGEMDVPKTKLLDAKAILWTFGKCLTAMLPVYLAGYYRMSTSLVVFGMMVYAGWKHSREAKEARLRSAIQLLNDEQEYISSKSFRSRGDLPSWVNFPDVEKVEWLNKVIHQAWPYIGQYLEKLLTETIAPSIRGSSTHLQTLSFTKIDFGGKPMKVVGVKAHSENEKGQILLDVYISYVGDVEINVEVKRYFCKAGVKGIQLHGMMRVILEPLIGDVPIVGAVTMFFIQRPKLTINWTGLTNLLDIPGVNMMSDTMIMDAIASFLVLPNRLTVPLVADLHVAQLRSPLPRGVVRIHLVEADSLAAKDTIVSGVSDPYALLRVGPQTFKSQHLDNTLNPKWGEMYEVIVHEVPGQELEVEVFDKDPNQDDFLGRTKLDLGIVKKFKIVDEWFTLKDTPTGRVHLRLEWLTLEADTGRLKEVLKRNESVVSKTAKPPSAAIMALYLDKAEALPMKKGNKDPNPIAQISVQDVTRDSRICWNTVNPQWEDAFTFFIRDPSKENISVQVKDNDRVQVLGSLSIPVSNLLSSPDLTLDQWFNLENSGSESRIHINTVLRVLCLDEAAVTSSLLSSGPLSKSSASRPQKSTPHSSFATEGLLRIHLVEAQNLVAKDNMMGGMVKGKSDPYVKIQIGGETFKSQVIKENLNPTWNEMYEVVLTQLPGQDLTLEVFDKDMDMKDDFMGRLKMNLSDIISSQYINEWFSLSDVKRGRVHLGLEWLPTVTQPEKLQQVLLYQSKTSYMNKTVPTAALLFVYVERAHELPLKKSGKEPKAAAELIFGDISHKTKVCDRATSPQWSEDFNFLVHNPREEILIIKLSSAFEQPLGCVVLPIRELLSKPDLLVDQWLSLDGASPGSQILLRAQLKILDSRMDSSVLHRKKPVVQEQHSVGEQHVEKAPVTAEHSQAAVSKESERKKLPAKGISNLAAFTLPVPTPRPEEPQKQTAAHVMDEHHTPSAPKTQITEDLSKLPDSTSNVAGYMEPVKTFGSSHEEQQHVDKPGEQSHKKVSPSVSAEESKVSSSTDVRPQKTSHDPSFGTKGVLRIHLLEAQDLVAKDNMMGGMVKGKSDPYVKIHIGETTFKSHVIKENLNPTWNEMYEVILSPDHNLDVKFEVYDKDVDSDDFLGRFKLKLGGIIRSQYNDEWFTLNDIKHGRVHLVLEWLPTATQRDRLEQVMQMQSTQSYQNKSVPSAAMLFILLDRAHELPLKKSGKEPKAAAELVLGGTSYKTKVCDRSTSPHWNEAFDFLVHDPKKDILVIKFSSAFDQPTGSLILPIRELLSKADLLMDQWLDLDGALPQSQVLLRAQLKILDSKMAALVAMGSGPVLSNKQTATTGQIKISLSFQKQLTVTVHACRGLVTSSKDSLDTYVSLILLPDKSKATKRKTSVKKKSLNPEFNERFEFDMSAEEAQRRELSVCVKNASSSFMNRDKDVIGQVQIDLGHVDFLSGVTEWFDLKEEQN